MDPQQQTVLYFLFYVTSCLTTFIRSSRSTSLFGSKTVRACGVFAYVSDTKSPLFRLVEMERAVDAQA